MVIEPRQVAPGYIRRWSRQALELMGRSFHTWFALSLGCCLLCWKLSGFAFPAAYLVVSFFLALSTELAATSDHHVLSVADLPAIARAALDQLKQEIWAHRGAITVVAVAGFIIVSAIAGLAHLAAAHLPPSAPVEPREPDYSRIWTWLSCIDSPFSSAGWAALPSAAIFGYSVGLDGMRYPLRRTFELDNETASLLASRALRKNRNAAQRYTRALHALLMVVVFGLPILAPLLLCFLPAVNYVAFREIFIDDNGNREVTKQSASVFVNQGAV